MPRDIIFAKRVMSVVVVLCMLSVCFAAVSTTAAADDSNVITSDDVVTLDVTKSFKDNSSELAKLGITKQSDWEWNEERESFSLTLDNVHFRTSANAAIIFTAPSSVQNPSISIRLVGTNSIVSGTDQVAPESVVEYKHAVGIVTSHLNAAGEEMNDFRVTIVGGGSIVVENENVSKNIVGSIAIEINGSLNIRRGADVIAHAADIDYVAKTPGKQLDMARFHSIGVYVAEKIVMSAKESGHPSLIATGGNVDFYITADSLKKPHILVSEGISAKSYSINNSKLIGSGGYVFWAVTEKFEKGEFALYSASVGISTREQSVIAGKEMHTQITNSKVVGTSSYAKGCEYAESTGIELGDEDAITIKDSIVVGIADVAESSIIRGEDTAGSANTTGIAFYGIADVTSSYVKGLSGEQALVSNTTSTKQLTGIYCNNDMTFRDSIVQAVGQGDGLGTDLRWSNGIMMATDDEGVMKAKYTLTIADSEVYLVGNSNAVFALDIENSIGEKGCYTYDDGTKKTIDVMEMKKYKAVSLLYKNDVIVENPVLGVMGFERVDDTIVTVDPYYGPVPDGMQFAGFFDADGNEIVVGSTVTLEQVNIVTVAFEPIEEPSENDDNSWIVWVVVIIALVVIALMAAGLYVWKSRN